MVKVPVTAAIRVLRKEKAAFEPHLYKYEERGGTAVSARELNVSEEVVVKTLILEDEKGSPMIVLMNGTHEVSLKKLARDLNLKAVKPCKPETAQKHSGYQVGGTSPFGVRKCMPVYLEKQILDFDTIYINGGKRGFLVSMTPAELQRILSPQLVEVAI